MRKLVCGMLVSGLMFVTGISLAENNKGKIPRQYKAWAERAPEDWRKRSAPPEGWEEVRTKDSLTMPKVDKVSRDRGWVVFAKPVFERIFPATASFSNDITEDLRAFATLGEYVPITFSVRALKDLKDFSVRISPLRSKDGSAVPVSQMDLRVVRCLPVAASAEKKEYIIFPAFMERFDTVRIGKDKTQRFWLTVKIPESAAPGNYGGKIVLTNDSVNSQEISLRIRVLPFTLQEADSKQMAFSIFHARGTDNRKTSYGRGIYNENLSKHFIDMAEHGLTSTGYGPMFPYLEKDGDNIIIQFDQPGLCSAYSMEDIMRLFQEAGLRGPIEYNVRWLIDYKISSISGKPMYTPEFDAAFRKVTKAIAEKVKKENWPELIFFMGDEPYSSAERMKKAKYYGKIVKEVAPEIRVSNYLNGDWAGVRDWLILCDAMDVCCINFTTKEILEERRQAGYKDIWLYNGGSGTTMMPVQDRIYYGFHTWKVKASGVTGCMYQDIYGDAFNHLDRDPYPPRAGTLTDYTYAYPTFNGPIPTPDWEAVRAGIYDWKYLYTLDTLIKKANEYSSGEIRNAAKNAKEEMDKIMSNFRYDFQSHAKGEILRDISPLSLDVYRWRIARQIIKLQKTMKNRKEQGK